MFVRRSGACAPTRLPSASGWPARRRGAHVVEFALIAPAVFLFILGIIEVGRGFMVIHLLNNAARDGCRAGIIPGTSSDAIKQQVSDTLTAHGVTGTTVQVLVNDQETEAASAASQDRITVSVTIPVERFTWVPGASILQGTLGGKYSLRRE